MSWSLGYDNNWKRDIGYGVPAFCDSPKCNKEIDRGLSYVCGAEEPYGGDNGCGLYFCKDHKYFHEFRNGDIGFFCKRCDSYKIPYKPKREHPKWIKHKLEDKSWAKWRKENSDLTKELINLLNN